MEELEFDQESRSRRAFEQITRKQRTEGLAFVSDLAGMGLNLSAAFNAKTLAGILFRGTIGAGSGAVRGHEFGTKQYFASSKKETYDFMSDPRDAESGRVLTVGTDEHRENLEHHIARSLAAFERNLTDQEALVKSSDPRVLQIQDKIKNVTETVNQKVGALQKAAEVLHKNKWAKLMATLGTVALGSVLVGPAVLAAAAGVSAFKHGEKYFKLQEMKRQSRDEWNRSIEIPDEIESLLDHYEFLYKSNLDAGVDNVCRQLKVQDEKAKKWGKIGAVGVGAVIAGATAFSADKHAHAATPQGPAGSASPDTGRELFRDVPDARTGVGGPDSTSPDAFRNVPGGVPDSTNESAPSDSGRVGAAGGKDPFAPRGIDATQPFKMAGGAGGSDSSPENAPFKIKPDAFDSKAGPSLSDSKSPDNPLPSPEPKSWNPTEVGKVEIDINGDGTKESFPIIEEEGKRFALVDWIDTDHDGKLSDYEHMKKFVVKVELGQNDSFEDKFGLVINKETGEVGQLPDGARAVQFLRKIDVVAENLGWSSEQKADFLQHLKDSGQYDTDWDGLTGRTGVMVDLGQMESGDYDGIPDIQAHPNSTGGLNAPWHNGLVAQYSFSAADRIDISGYPSDLHNALENSSIRLKALSPDFQQFSVPDGKYGKAAELLIDHRSELPKSVHKLIETYVGDKLYGNQNIDILKQRIVDALNSNGGTLKYADLSFLNKIGHELPADLAQDGKAHFVLEGSKIIVRGKEFIVPPLGTGKALVEDNFNSMLNSLSDMYKDLPKPAPLPWEAEPAAEMPGEIKEYMVEGDLGDGLLNRLSEQTQKDIAEAVSTIVEPIDGNYNPLITIEKTAEGEFSIRVTDPADPDDFKTIPIPADQTEAVEKFIAENQIKEAIEY